MEYYKDRFIASFWWGGLALNVSVWMLFWLFLPFQKDPVNLHYTIFFGIDKIGSWWELFLVPGIGLVLHVLFVFLVKNAYTQQALLGRVLLAMTVLFQLGLFALGVLLVRLNT